MSGQLKYPYQTDPNLRGCPGSQEGRGQARRPLRRPQPRAEEDYQVPTKNKTILIAVFVYQQNPQANHHYLAFYMHNCKFNFIFFIYKSVVARGWTPGTAWSRTARKRSSFFPSTPSGKLLKILLLIAGHSNLLLAPSHYVSCSFKTYLQKVLYSVI